METGVLGLNKWKDLFFRLSCKYATASLNLFFTKDRNAITWILQTLLPVSCPDVWNISYTRSINAQPDDMQTYSVYELNGFYFMLSPHRHTIVL